MIHIDPSGATTPLSDIMVETFMSAFKGSNEDMAHKLCDR